MPQIDDAQNFFADLHRQPIEFPMRQFKEFMEQAELVHELEGGRVHSVAAKVTQKIGVFFQHHDLNAGARQKEAEHHSGRTAAGNTALRVTLGSRHGSAFALNHSRELAASMIGIQLRNILLQGKRRR
jgi:hypothetical protein